MQLRLAILFAAALLAFVQGLFPISTSVGGLIAYSRPHSAPTFIVCCRRFRSWTFVVAFDSIDLLSYQFDHGHFNRVGGQITVSIGTDSIGHPRITTGFLGRYAKVTIGTSEVHYTSKLYSLTKPITYNANFPGQGVFDATV